MVVGCAAVGGSDGSDDQPPRTVQRQATSRAMVHPGKGEKARPAQCPLSHPPTAPLSPSSIALLAAGRGRADLRTSLRRSPTFLTFAQRQDSATFHRRRWREMAAVWNWLPEDARTDWKKLESHLSPSPLLVYTFLLVSSTLCVYPCISSLQVVRYVEVKPSSLSSTLSHQARRCNLRTRHGCRRPGTSSAERNSSSFERSFRLWHLCCRACLSYKTHRFRP